MSTPYGAFELKRHYQKNMLIGTAVAALLAAAVTGSIWIWIGWATDSRTDVAPDIGLRPLDSLFIIIRPPPSIERESRPVVDKGMATGKPPETFIPVPSPDPEVAEEMPLWPEPGLQGPGTSNGNPMETGPRGIIAVNPDTEYIPPPDTFISFEEEPVLVHEEPPGYPRLAREGGFTADVLVQAFIGADGRVKKVEAVRCTRPGMGFEDAAEKAAYKSVYKPAIQNGTPVGVWIAYKVKFVLE